MLPVNAPASIPRYTPRQNDALISHDPFGHSVVLETVCPLKWELYT